MNKDGSGRQPVDLYYHSGDRKFIRIGSPQDTEKRYVILNERLRNVPQEELQDTASYLYNHGGAPAGMSPAAYAKQYMEKISKSKTWVGRLDWMLLPSGIRTLIGPKSGLPTSVDGERANAAVQRWYGEYSLPADVYVVKKGTDLAAYGRSNRLDEKSSVFLKKGYIVVNFNIETIREGNTAKPHLQYIHAPLMNQWQLEGYSRTYTDPYGKRFTLLTGMSYFTMQINPVKGISNPRFPIKIVMNQPLPFSGGGWFFPFNNAARPRYHKDTGQKPSDCSMSISKLPPFRLPEIHNVDRSHCIQ